MLRLKDYNIFMGLVINICFDYIFTSFLVAFCCTKNNDTIVNFFFYVRSYPM